ncbi:MAG: hypothetical protein ACFFBH_13865 [Promethearchaeota archaeon]
MAFDRNRDLWIILCCFSVVAFTIFFLVPLVMDFFRYFAFYWYISFPIFVSILVILKITYSRMSKNTLYRTLDSIGNQRQYTEETGIKATDNGKLTKSYKKWLMKDISNLKMTTKEDSINEVLILVIGLVVFILLAFTIMSYLGFYFRF